MREATWFKAGPLCTHFNQQSAVVRLRQVCGHRHVRGKHVVDSLEAVSQEEELGEVATGDEQEATRQGWHASWLNRLDDAWISLVKATQAIFESIQLLCQCGVDGALLCQLWLCGVGGVCEGGRAGQQG